jgi:hypothetical protein
MNKLIQRREATYSKVRVAAARTGRMYSDPYGMFCAARFSEEGRQAIQAYQQACSAIKSALRGTRYGNADPEYI